MGKKFQKLVTSNDEIIGDYGIFHDPAIMHMHNIKKMIKLEETNLLDQNHTFVDSERVSRSITTSNLLL